MPRQRGPVRGSTRRTRDQRRRAANRPLVQTTGPTPLSNMNRTLQRAAIIVGFVMLAALILSILANLFTNTQTTTPTTPTSLFGSPHIAYAADAPAYGLVSAGGDALRFGGNHPAAWDDDVPPTASLDAPPATQTATSLAGHRTYIGETGHFLADPFFNAWNIGGGGARALGMPISEAFTQTTAAGTLTVQYFERARLQIAPGASTVTYGALGSEYAQMRGYALAQGAFAPHPATTTATVRAFPDTQHTLAYGFKALWENLASTTEIDGGQLLGSPISEELTEDGQTVQYFERGRMEVKDGKAVVSPIGSLYIAAQGWPRPTVYAIQTNVKNYTTSQGQVIKLRVSGDSPLAPTALHGTFDTDTLRFGQDGTAAIAFAPIGPDRTPATYPLTVAFTDAAGRTRSLYQNIEVTAHDYGTQDLQLVGDLEALANHNADAYDDTQLAPAYNLFSPQILWKGEWPWPLKVDWTQTTDYAQRRTYNGKLDTLYYHGGIDLAPNSGKNGDPIYNAAAGKVIYVGTLQARGVAVVVDQGMGVTTYYFHMQKTSVQVGQTVQVDDVLGTVGSTGRATGPHLDWEVRVNGIITDPRDFMKEDLSQ